jgi:hypothetical protein
MNDNAIRPDRIGHEGEEMFIREPAAVCVALMRGKERVDRCRQLFLHERDPASFYEAVSRLSELQAPRRRPSLSRFYSCAPAAGSSIVCCAASSAYFAARSGRMKRKIFCATFLP